MGEVNGLILALFESLVAQATLHCPSAQSVWMPCFEFRVTYGMSPEKKNHLLSWKNGEILKLNEALTQAHAINRAITFIHVV